MPENPTPESHQTPNPNLSLYNAIHVCPPEAQKPITSGRLSGKTDINPMWRIKALTEALGPCGVGWKYEVTRQWTETYGPEVKCFTNINLFIRHGGEWSEPIPGTGGSSLVSVEKKGPYVSDEAYKMALTDALSVAMKALGMAANIYFSKDAVYDSKYTAPQPSSGNPVPDVPPLDPALMARIQSAPDLESLKQIWLSNPQSQQDRSFTEAVTARKNILMQTNKQ